jgi:Skp family chaperone for outer membrane proteins
MAPTFKKSDPVVDTLLATIDKGIAEIVKANESLLQEESGTSVRDIDKVLKDEKAEVPADIKKLWAKAEAIRKSYKEAVDAARNKYRLDVLGEEAKESSDEDNTELTEKTREVRKVVMDSLNFIKTYATPNGMLDIVDWANSVEVPQVGRKGTSTAAGKSKPRVYVKNLTSGHATEGTVYDSFSKAAADLSTKENKFTAGDLADAWNEAGGNEGEFKYGDFVLNVTLKQKGNNAAG